MKILVASDTHNDTDYFLQIVRTEMPDAVIHLGDHTHDIRPVREAFPTLPLYCVRGNNDFTMEYPLERQIRLCDVPMLLTHGHAYCVREGVTRLSLRAAELEVRIALFGHTHIPLLETHNGIVFLNPGSANRHQRGRAKESYAVLQLESGGFSCSMLPT